MNPIVVCPNCGSEKLHRRRCPACLDMTDEQWALHDAHAAYVADQIDGDELERRVEEALTSPPRRRHPHLVYR